MRAFVVMAVKRMEPAPDFAWWATASDDALRAWITADTRTRRCLKPLLNAAKGYPQGQQVVLDAAAHTMRRLSRRLIHLFEHRPDDLLQRRITLEDVTIQVAHELFQGDTR